MAHVMVGRSAAARMRRVWLAWCAYHWPISDMLGRVGVAGRWWPGAGLVEGVESVSEEGSRSGGASNASVPRPAAARVGPISHAIFRLARIHRMTAGQLLRPIGLHPNQELLMMQLWHAGPQRQADLVTMLDSDSATITRTIQRLERAGFVRRSPSAADRRVTIVEATVASQALRREVERVWRRLEELTVDGLDDDERRVALRMMERLESNLGRPAPEPGRRARSG